MEHIDIPKEMRKKLGSEEVLKLIRKYKRTKDTDVRNKIVMSNIDLVLKIAKKYESYSSGSMSFEDIVSNGILGLIESVEKFEVKFKTKFTTYAYYRILKKISENITIGTLNLPPHRIEIIRKYHKMISEALDKNKTPDYDEICKKIGVGKKTLFDTLWKKDSVSIEGPFPEAYRRKSSSSRANLCAVKNNMEEELNNSIDFERVNSIMLAKLDDREMLVIRGRFGFGEKKEKTLGQLAKELGVSLEYVRLIQKKAIKKLRRFVVER